MGETLPPLRVREPDGSPNVIPVYDMIMSTNLVVQNRGGGVIALSATTGAGAGTVYAATGNSYIVTDFATDLTGEFRLVQSGNSITINTASNLIIINAVTNAAASNIVYAATGNSYVVTDLAADLTGEFRLVQSGNSITIDTTGNLIIINAATGITQLVYAQTGDTFLVYSASTGMSAERVIAASDNITIVSSGTSFLISATTSDISGKQNTITYPLGINSGGTGKVSLNAYSILYGSGITSIQTMPVLGSGWLVVGSAITAGPQTLAVGSHGQMLVVDTSVAGALIWSNTLGGASGAVYAATGNDYVVMNLAGDLTNEYRLVQSGNSITVTTAAGLITINAVTNPTVSTQTIRIPMALMSVEVNSGNAFWTAQTDTTRMDKAYVNMVDSGRSVSTWWCDVPYNLNSTPAWAFEILSEAATLAATGGFLILNVDGMSSAHGESSNVLASDTIRLVQATSFRLSTAGLLTLSTMTTTDFDAPLGTSASDYMKLKITRQGNVDTLNSDWYIYSVRARFTVDT